MGTVFLYLMLYYIDIIDIEFKQRKTVLMYARHYTHTMYRKKQADKGQRDLFNIIFYR